MVEAAEHNSGQHDSYLVSRKESNTICVRLEPHSRLTLDEDEPPNAMFYLNETLCFLQQDHTTTNRSMGRGGAVTSTRSDILHTFSFIPQEIRNSPLWENIYLSYFYSTTKSTVCLCKFRNVPPTQKQGHACYLQISATLKLFLT